MMNPLMRIIAFSAAQIFTALTIGAFFYAQPCFSLEKPEGNGCAYHAPDIQSNAFMQSVKISALKYIPQAVDVEHPLLCLIRNITTISEEKKVSGILPYSELYTFAKFSTSTFF
jgi:hypothetical protein